MSKVVTYTISGKDDFTRVIVSVYPTSVDVRAESAYCDNYEGFGEATLTVEGVRELKDTLEEVLKSFNS